VAGAFVGLVGTVSSEDSRQSSIIESSEAGEERVGLEKKTDSFGAEAGKFPTGKFQQVCTLKFERTIVGPGESSEQSHEGGFAGTGPATDGDKFSAADFKRDTVHSRDGATACGVDPGEVVGAENDTHSRPSLMSW
jgi:hypothetical protein